MLQWLSKVKKIKNTNKKKQFIKIKYQKKIYEFSCRICYLHLQCPGKQAQWIFSVLGQLIFFLYKHI